MPKVARADDFAPALTEAMQRFGITHPKSVAGFLAQVLHETGGFSRLEENLSYSAARLMLVWPKRFSSIDIAMKYQRNPQALANVVYANRMGNGDTASGEGFKYRGRGLIQLTGKDNYRACGNALGVDLLTNPDLLLQPKYAALSAAWYWSSRGLSAKKYQDDFDKVSDVVNIGRETAVIGDSVGYAERHVLYIKACELLKEA